VAQHSHRTLHRRLAALYALTRPDFCIIEGLTATAHGHSPPTALLDECLVPMNILVGGPDTLAVDVVGARVLGYGLDEVEHLRLCAEWDLGEGDGDREHRLDDLAGDILVVGPCACQEVRDVLAQRYPGRRIYRVAEHNDLMSNTRYQARLMGVTPVNMVPLNPLVSALILLQAKLHGLTARVPPLLG